MKFSTAAVSRYLPAAGAIIGAVTYTTCRIIFHAYEHFMGSIPWPFFSTIGRDYPEYFVFVTGGFCGSLAFLALIHFVVNRVQVWNSQCKKTTRNRVFHTICLVGCAFGALAQPFLIGLAVFDTGHHDTAHNISAAAFFLFSAIFLLSYVCFVCHMGSLYSSNKYLVRSVNIKLIVSSIFLISFMNYIPIGSFFICPTRFLSVYECIKIRTLGEVYCFSSVNLNDPEYTVLQTYEDCPEVSTMITINQFICMLSLLAFNASFSIDLSPELITLVDQNNTILSANLSHIEGHL